MISKSWRHDINFKMKYFDSSCNTIKMLYWVHDISTTFLCYRNQDINNKAIAASMLVFRWTGFRLTLVSVVLVTAVVVSTLLLVKDPGKNYSGAPPYGELVVTASHFFTYRRNAHTLSVCHRDVANGNIPRSQPVQSAMILHRLSGHSVELCSQLSDTNVVWTDWSLVPYKIISASPMLIKNRCLLFLLRRHLV